MVHFPELILSISILINQLNTISGGTGGMKLPKGGIK